MTRYISFGLAIAVCIAAAAAAWKDRGHFDRTIKESMQSKMGVEITALTLIKQPDGSHTGTATTADGGTYAVAITPPINGDVEWRVTPSRATFEKKVRDHMKSGFNTDVKEIRLRELFHSGYEGTATATDGRVYDVVIEPPGSNGMSELKVIPAQALVEKGMREWIETQTKVAIQSLSLEKQSPGFYRGTAVLADGSKLRVNTVAKGSNVEWAIVPVK